MPETALPYFKHELPDGYWETLAKQTKEDKKFAIVGIPTQDSNKGYGNSAIGWVVRRKCNMTNTIWCLLENLPLKYFDGSHG
jgi:apolipoprotein N-acyltransferase